MSLAIEIVNDLNDLLKQRQLNKKELADWLSLSDREIEMVLKFERPLTQFELVLANAHIRSIDDRPSPEILDTIDDAKVAMRALLAVAGIDSETISMVSNVLPEAMVLTRAVRLKQPDWDRISAIQEISALAFSFAETHTISTSDKQPSASLRDRLRAKFKVQQP